MVLLLSLVQNILSSLRYTLVPHMKAVRTKILAHYKKREHYMNDMMSPEAYTQQLLTQNMTMVLCKNKMALHILLLQAHCKTAMENYMMQALYMTMDQSYKMMMVGYMMEKETCMMWMGGCKKAMVYCKMEKAVVHTTLPEDCHTCLPLHK